MPSARDAKLTSSFSDVVNKVAPCVVYVYSTRTVRRPDLSELLPFNDPVLRRFFGDQFDQDNSQPAPEHKQHGLGSGVLVSKDGYLLTNNHVVEGADEVKVALADNKKQYPAKVVGRDPKTDLAVLKIEGEDLPFAAFGDSDTLKVGDVVLAVGNPFGVGQTVTMGIISATRRGGMGIEHYEDFIQTDAAINPGNSGGALVDTQGRLIGINTAILSRTGGFQGVGFAVPVNLAKHVMEQIIKTGQVVRGYLGVSVQNLTPELAKAFDVPGGEGALIGGVMDGGSADEAGLRSGDVVVEFDGKKVAESRQLMLLVGSMAPGTKAKVKVIREGKETNFEVTLKQMPENPMAADDEPDDPSTSDVLTGVAVADLNPSNRQRLNVPQDVTGALVARIDRASPAYESGVRAGDVIQEIDRKKVASAAEAVAAANKAKGDQVLLRLWRQGGSRFAIVKNKAP
jgi:serine protease Do